MKKDRFPPRWVTVLYKTLAVGRYAALWLPELLDLYSKISAEEGEERANEWLVDELSSSAWPSLTYRIFKLLRVVYLTWEAYRRVARD